ncbi:putative ANKRD40 C-terminal-like protein [Ursus americanus]|uniref:ANKRD40 C-terminal-like protein n=1 Tax=Ursus maritimus TaxID=29073 RepID=A0A8M1GJH3_URSMA|nr:putative ANKRD40 C-terminal-like protein [Ursus maritimus]XP_045629057.1 putative ANKRD40 C-terminal-like protein [Ursus americanus]
MAEPQQDRREKPAVRIQSPRENDFIEVELNRGELSYQNLLEVSCSELGIEPEQVKTIRKLPNTLLRKDKDIRRLRDFQEIELILMKHGSSELVEYTPSLTEKPCYNSNAAKLTY